MTGKTDKPVPIEDAALDSVDGGATTTLLDPAPTTAPARTTSPAGVNILLGDGSVRFVRGD